MIQIVNYGVGNFTAVANMLDRIGTKCEIIADPNNIVYDDFSKLIFPGVGSFDAAMSLITSNGWVDPLNKFILNPNNKLLGICLGMQLLFEKSEEAPNVNGLGVLEGEVLKFKQGKIPQIGWNKIKTTSNNSILEDEHYYFVNSYYVKPKDEQIVSSYCNYHVDFAASIEKENLIAVQFHPEKSGEAGIRVFEKWLNL
jgi:imidazole glycerol phosphate synthase glutamine amidotransferase subunit